MSTMDTLKTRAGLTDIGFALGMAMVLFILIFKLPTMMLDLLLVCSISAGFLVMLMTLYISTPLQLSSFPAILLIVTLFRLSLNVASTKLILLDGHAGEVIHAFGTFVIQGNYFVGIVIFLIITMIQFKVVTEGATRIAEVAARFTLDALPGKQMSIDADLNAGLIDEREAQDRRKKLNDEASFYGSMDGANKFVKGDVVAGLIILIINIVGGIGIGMIQKNMPIEEALKHYTTLTIGEGLVSQIPSLVISVAAGILVTRSTKQGAMGSQVFTELLAQPTPLYVCSLILAIIAILPGLPFLPFAILSGGIFTLARVAEKGAFAAVPAAAGAAAKAGAPGTPPAPGAPAAAPEDKYNKPVNPMQLEIGFSLVPLVDVGQGGDLVERIGNIRSQIYDDLGFRIPPVSVKDNSEIGAHEYRILVRGLERARGQVHVGYHLAINPGDVRDSIEGIKAKDPAFGFDAVWISPKRVEAAEALGYTVVDAASVITTHITKLVRDYAPDMLARQDVSNMLEKLKETHASVVNEVTPEPLSVGVIHRVLQNLLGEKVPIHDLALVLETLADHAATSKDPQVLAEHCRQALRGHISSRCLADGKTLFGVTIQPELEHEIVSSITQNNGGIGLLTLAPDRASEIVRQITQVTSSLKESTGTDVCLLVSPLIRSHLQQLVSRKAPELPVLSYAEISDDLPVEIVGNVQAPR